MKPPYLSTVGAVQFYKNLGTIECPKCSQAFSVNTPPNVLMASDIAVDLCPYCRTYVVINMTATDPVHIEGYLDRTSVDGRVLELSGRSNAGA